MINIAGLKIPVISLPDLMTLKKKANREKDRSDLSNLRKIGRIKGKL